MLRYSEMEKNQKDRENLWRSAVEVPVCRDLLWEILEFCAIYQDPTVNDKGTLEFLTGRQSVARFIIANLLQTDANLYPKLLTEMQKLRR